MTRLIRWASALGIMLVVDALTSWGWAQETTTPPTPDPLSQPLGPWAVAAFIWMILILALVFVIMMTWLGRSRRY